jgi:hypothetical protein
LQNIGIFAVAIAVECCCKNNSRFITSYKPCTQYYSCGIVSLMSNTDVGIVLIDEVEPPIAQLNVRS